MFINGAVSNHDSGYQTYAKGRGITPQPLNNPIPTTKTR
jgi:hypothetical protein